MKPYLSIIIPIYNSEKYLEKCIRSVLEQRFRDYELILVDNGSTDHSLNICRFYAKKDSRIRVICKKHGEVMSARKAGLRFSHGEYISFVDSDDWMEAGFYDILSDPARYEHADIILMTGYQEDSGEKIKKVRTGLRKQGIFQKRDIIRLLVQGAVIPCMWLKIFKSRLIKENIEFVEDYVFRGEDMLCSYACLLDARTVFVQNNSLYHYVQHESSLVRSYMDVHRKNLYYFVKDIQKIRQEKGVYFLDHYWNQFILKELMYLITNECKNNQLSKRKFRQLQLRHILIGKNGRDAVRIRPGKERIALHLYELGFFCLLNIYMKKEFL